MTKMSSFFRFFSKRQLKPGLTPSVLGHDAQQPPTKHEFRCDVTSLEDEVMCINMPKNATGQALIEHVALRLDLMEIDYFGLQFTGRNNVQCWLDPTKKLKKQVQTGPPYNFNLRVKFYPSEPSCLREELTRYLLVLQLKQDLLSGKLQCPFETAIDLAAFSLQAELGDYDPQVHTAAMVSEFRFLPESQQTAQFELAALEKFKSLRGLPASGADSAFLQRAKLVEHYGVDSHRVLGKDGKWYLLGITPSGILVYECASVTKIGFFVWNTITKLAFSRAKLTIIVDDDTGGRSKQHVFTFTLPNSAACKCLWKSAIEQHSFFRLTVPSQSASAPSRHLLRTGSRFRYVGRTEFQTTLQPARRSARFERKPTQRSSRRASFEQAELDAEARSKAKEREAKKLATLQRIEVEESADPCYANLPSVAQRPTQITLQAVPDSQERPEKVVKKSTSRIPIASATTPTPAATRDKPDEVELSSSGSDDRVRCVASSVLQNAAINRTDSKEDDDVSISDDSDDGRSSPASSPPPLSSPTASATSRIPQVRRVAPPSSIPKPVSTSTTTKQSGIPTPISPTTPKPVDPQAFSHTQVVTSGIDRSRLPRPRAGKSASPEAFGGQIATSSPSASSPVYQHTSEPDAPSALEALPPHSLTQSKFDDCPPSLPPKAIHSRIAPPGSLTQSQVPRKGTNLQSPTSTSGRSGIPVFQATASNTSQLPDSGMLSSSRQQMEPLEKKRGGRMTMTSV